MKNIVVLVLITIIQFFSVYANSVETELIYDDKTSMYFFSKQNIDVESINQHGCPLPISASAPYLDVHPFLHYLGKQTRAKMILLGEIQNKEIFFKRLIGRADIEIDGLPVNELWIVVQESPRKQESSYKTEKAAYWFSFMLKYHRVLKKDLSDQTVLEMKGKEYLPKVKYLLFNDFIPKKYNQLSGFSCLKTGPYRWLTCDASYSKSSNNKELILAHTYPEYEEGQKRNSLNMDMKLAGSNVLLGSALQMPDGGLKLTLHVLVPVDHNIDELDKLSVENITQYLGGAESGEITFEGLIKYCQGVAKDKQCAEAQKVWDTLSALLVEDGQEESNENTADEVGSQVAVGDTQSDDSLTIGSSDGSSTSLTMQQEIKARQAVDNEGIGRSISDESCIINSDESVSGDSSLSQVEESTSDENEMHSGANRSSDYEPKGTGARILRKKTMYLVSRMGESSNISNDKNSKYYRIKKSLKNKLRVPNSNDGKSYLKNKYAKYSLLHAKNGIDKAVGENRDKLALERMLGKFFDVCSDKQIASVFKSRKELFELLQGDPYVYKREEDIPDFL